MSDATDTTDATDSQPEAWGYVRLSQTGRDGSLDDQKAALRQYARSRDLRLVTTRNDGDRTSGFNADRDEYQLVRQQIQDGAIDAVITRDRARLSRDFGDRVRLLLDLRNSPTDWHVVEAGGPIEVADELQFAIEVVHAATDHQKKIAEIERARDATEARLESGADHGRPPFGLTYDDEGRNWVPGENFDRAIAVIDARLNGKSWRDTATTAGIDKDKARRVWNRRTRYLEHVDDGDH